MRKGKNAVSNVLSIDRRSQAWKLRCEGHDWKDIAEAVGYKNGNVAKLSVDKYRLNILAKDKETIEDERDRRAAFIQNQMIELSKKLDWTNDPKLSLAIVSEIRAWNDQLIKLNGLNKQDKQQEAAFSIPITITLPEGFELPDPAKLLKLPALPLMQENE